MVDKVTEWKLKAAEQYKADGASDGWDSNDSEPETAEQKYIRASPLQNPANACLRTLKGAYIRSSKAFKSLHRTWLDGHNHVPDQIGNPDHAAPMKKHDIIVTIHISRR